MALNNQEFSDEQLVIQDGTQIPSVNSNTSGYILCLSLLEYIRGRINKSDVGLSNVPNVDFTNRVESIEGKIPSQATSLNQLADKAFVNSSIATNTATFKGTYSTLEELKAITGADENDYAFYVHKDTAGNTIYDRYKYTSGTDPWQFEYSLNNSSFTSDQWQALNSGITKSLKQAYDNHIANQSNPHSVTKEQVGLGSVDNTSDLDKPVSTATWNAINNEATTRENADTALQTAIDSKADSSNVYTKEEIDTNTLKKSTTSAIPLNTDKFYGEEKYYTGANVNKYIRLQMASSPSCYKRPSLFTTNKTTITIPSDTWVNINGTGYISESDVTINLSTIGDASARKGKDVYVYACQPSSGTEPTFVLSLNSTIPTGYTADTSRKIGGFHCLCADVGTISGHTLSGYSAGDALPNSQWDLLHRAQSNNEGMVWISEVNRWVDIYLCSVSNSKLVSVYGGTIADGTSSTAFNGEKFAEWLGLVKKKPLSRHEFMVAMKGSNENTNISGSADPTTTGGHIDTASRRIISNYGLEDGCGVMWQWLYDLFENYPGSTWSSSKFYLLGYSWQGQSVYNSTYDSQKYGSCYGLFRRVRAGGDWSYGSVCGSRSGYCDGLSSSGGLYYGVRGSSEPRVVNS